MSDSIKREARQRTLVSRALEDYRSGACTLRRLCEGLQALTLELRLVPQEWLVDFQAEANALEVLYAVALDRDVLDDLPADYRTDIDETLAHIEALMAQLPALPDYKGA
ncbi:hypothetical protein [Streptomyces anandii]|uniref:hypothetical protein n=1 Tax=Streptomyces anandii TaxID=285454 RepID=UPI0037BB29D9